MKRRRIRTEEASRILFASFLNVASLESVKVSVVRGSMFTILVQACRIAVTVDGWNVQPIATERYLPIEERGRYAHRKFTEVRDDLQEPGPGVARADARPQISGRLQLGTVSAPCEIRNPERRHHGSKRARCGHCVDGVLMGLEKLLNQWNPPRVPPTPGLDSRRRPWDDNFTPSPPPAPGAGILETSGSTRSSTTATA